MMYSFDPIEIINRYYEKDSLSREILIAHGEDVRNLALSIVRAYPEYGADETFVAEASMLHDLGIFLTDAPKIGCHGSEPYIRHGYLGAELLRSLGLERHAHVAERHTGSGLTRGQILERGIDLPEGIYIPQTIEEEIICYADKFFSKTRLGERKELSKVRASLSKHGEESLRRFDDMHARFALKDFWDLGVLKE